MIDIRHISLPLTDDVVRSLKIGDSVMLSGCMYTARDAAHKRMIEGLDHGRELPFDIQNQTIFYVGPSPAKPGQIIGSAGPTTSYRMDPYTETLLDIGLKGMIGKGLRSQAVIDSIKKNTAVYFAAVGGAAALIAKSIISKELVAYEDLGPEAIYKLEVENFPVIVVIDCLGNCLYD
ncbi:MAG: Fe-S-containing hydro-lyase [Eubacteriales bacterium]|nr:Fe-S-containing hydro-lyase [Eubacteriales bacterium]